MYNGDSMVIGHFPHAFIQATPFVVSNKMNDGKTSCTDRKEKKAVVHKAFCPKVQHSIIGKL